MTLVSKANAEASAEAVRTESIAGANTANRVGQAMRDFVDSAIFGGTSPGLGYSPFFNGTIWQLIGAAPGSALTDANQTLTVAGGAFYALPATVPLTANREKTLSLSGVAGGLGFTIVSLGTRAFTMAIKDAGGAILYTFPASSQLILASFRVKNDATAWELGNWVPLGALVTP